MPQIVLLPTGPPSTLVALLLRVCPSYINNKFSRAALSRLAHCRPEFTNHVRSPGACPQAARIGRRWTSQTRSLGDCPAAAMGGRHWTSHARSPLPKSIAHLLPYGFIWTPFCPDLDQAIFEPRYALPKLWQICF